MTPTLRVSPVAPEISLDPPPDPHAANTAPDRLTAAADPIPALVAHPMKWRREMSLLTCRSMKSRSWSGVMPSPPCRRCCVVNSEHRHFPGCRNLRPQTTHAARNEPPRLKDPSRILSSAPPLIGSPGDDLDGR